MKKFTLSRKFGKYNTELLNTNNLFEIFNKINKSVLMGDMKNVTYTIKLNKNNKNVTMGEIL